MISKLVSWLLIGCYSYSTAPLIGLIHVPIVPILVPNSEKIARGPRSRGKRVPNLNHNAPFARYEIK